MKILLSCSARRESRHEVELHPIYLCKHLSWSPFFPPGGIYVLIGWKIEPVCPSVRLKEKKLPLPSQSILSLSHHENCRAKMYFGGKRKKNERQTLSGFLLLPFIFSHSVFSNVFISFAPRFQGVPVGTSFFPFCLGVS